MNIRLLTKYNSQNLKKRLLCQPKSLPFTDIDGGLEITLSSPGGLNDLVEHSTQFIKEILIRKVMDERLSMYGYTEEFKTCYVLPILSSSVVGLSDFKSLQEAFKLFMDERLEKSNEIELDSFIRFNVSVETEFLNGVLTAMEQAIFEEMLEVVIEASTDSQLIPSMPTALEGSTVDFDIDNDGVVMLFKGQEHEVKSEMVLGVSMNNFEKIISEDSQRLEEVFTIAASFLLILQNRVSKVLVRQEYFDHLYAYLFEKYKWVADVEMIDE